MDVIKCYRMINFIGLYIVLDNFIPEIDSRSILAQKLDKISMGR